MKSSKYRIIGPFSSLLTFEDLPIRGPISNEKLEIRKNVAVVTKDGCVEEIDDYQLILNKYHELDHHHERTEGHLVGLPGFIDSHSHICFGGSRHVDYSERNAGVSYLEIARRGGGIWDTVQKTRKATALELLASAKERLDKMLRLGITTAEIKSGYGLDLENELKQLTVIQHLNDQSVIDCVSTCLAAHIKPKDYAGDNTAYLCHIENDLLHKIKAEKLSRRIDIFVEEDAFTVDQARSYLSAAKAMGFEITVHGDQFSPGGSMLAVEMGAVSVDHLETSTKKEIEVLGRSETVATVLPGASLGIGCDFAPARKLLDAGAILAIASDWNPGSAPMGDLLTQASILGASEKLTDAEVLAGMTFRAAKALSMGDRGKLEKGCKADICAFEASDYRELLYNQGQLKPSVVWKNGELAFSVK